MRIIEQYYDVEKFDLKDVLNKVDDIEAFKKAIYFDLEHYVYKKPICIGIFGCCYYDEETNKLFSTQYMIENKNEVHTLLLLARDYFQRMYSELNKRYIVTFSGNNDFTVINSLFKQYGVDFDIKSHFKEIDLQKEFSKLSNSKENIGLKNLEKIAGINRKNELISGITIAKTFAKIIKDADYINRVPKEKIDRILNYNLDDVVNLYYIYVKWEKIKKFVLEGKYVEFKEDLYNNL